MFLRAFCGLSVGSVYSHRDTETPRRTGEFHYDTIPWSPNPTFLFLRQPEQLALAAAERFVEYSNELLDMNEGLVSPSREGTRRAAL